MDSRSVGSCEGLVPAPDTSGSGLTPNGRRMLEAIDSLPDDEREAFGLVRVQGMTHVEAARLLGVASVTVKRRLNRGLRLLAGQARRPASGRTPMPKLSPRR